MLDNIAHYAAAKNILAADFFAILVLALALGVAGYLFVRSDWECDGEIHQNFSVGLFWSIVADCSG